MKKLLQFIFLLLVSSTTVIAQSQKNIAQKQLEIKAKEERAKKNQSDIERYSFEVLSKKSISLQDYTAFKKSGKLSKRYEYVIENGKLSPSPINIPAKTSSLTPCSEWPVQGPTAYTTEVDDSPLVPIALPFDFCFYGVTYNAMNISANGNVQFATNSTAFSATGFPNGPAGVNMIAPFWSDGESMVASGGLTYGKIYIDMYATSIIISWDSLGYFNNHVDKLNSFQLVLTDGLDPILPPGKNVGFRYKKMQWTTGDASGGTNGFPTTQPGTPATVGVNQGNGVDYYLVGRFGLPGSNYDGPLGNSDGVSWLDGKSFYFNVCPPVGANVEPVATLIGYCDTLKVCGNDTLYIKNTFLAPEVTQSVNITASAPTLGSSFSFSVIPGTNSSDIYMIVDGNTAPSGFHTVTMTATDNGSPAQSSVQTFVVAANGAAINNLNGTIVVTPTLGACPGGTVTASVNVTGGVVDEYFWNNNASTPTTTFTTAIPQDSLIFVTLTQGQCQKTILGHININPVPVASILGNTSYCNGDTNSVILTATNTSTYGIQSPYTYAWSATSGTLSANNTQTVSATGGVYTMTLTNQYGCTSVASTTITMNASPMYTITSSNAVSGGSVYCVSQDSARLVLNFGTGGGGSACNLASSPCAVSNFVQVGTATTEGSTSSYTPFNGIWESAKHQYLIRASELTSAGVVAGKLSSLAFRVTNLNTNNPIFENFSVKLKCVAYNTVGASMDNTGLIQVYGPATITTSVGVNTYNFTQPYLWDGTSNLLVDVCWFNPNWDGNISVQYTNVGYNASLNLDADNVNQCPLSTVDATTTNRPNMIFGNCLAQQSGTQFNVVVTPTTGVVIPTAHDSIKIDLPNSPGITCYTVSLINPVGGCNKDTVICVNATQGVTQGTLATNNATVCPGNPVTLSAQGALTSYTIAYVDDAGTAQTSINSSVTFTPSSATTPTFGVHTYTLFATAACGGPLTAFTQTVEVIQGVTQGTLSSSAPATCPNGTITLSAQGSLTSYTISYNDQFGALQTSVNSSVTVTTPSVSGTYVYTLSATGPCSGPLTSFTTSVDVLTGVTLQTLTATSNSICPGTPITLNAVGNLVTYTITYTDDSGLHTSVNSSVTVIPTGTTSPVFGPHTYTLSGMGGCGGPLEDTTLVITVIQGVTQGTLSVSDASVCPGSPVTLSALGSLTSYTIAYDDGTGVQTSINNSVTIVPTNTTAPVFGVHTYTLMATGPCSGPLTSFTGTVDVVQGVTQGTLAVSNPTVCPGSSVTLSALGSLTSYTIAYDNGTGVQTSINSSVTIVPTNTTAPVFGVHTYTLMATGPCSGPLTSFTGTVNVVQGVTDATLTASSATVCPGSPVTLSVSGSAVQTYTIVYTDATGTQTATPNTSVTFTPSSVSSPSFGIQTYTVLAEGPCNGPLAAFTTTVNVIQGVTDGTLTATPSVVCIGSPITLSASGTALSTYTINYNNGAGTQSSVNSPVTFNTATSGTITYSLIGQGFCSAPVTTVVATATINALTNLTISPIADVTKCLGGTATLNANVSPAISGITYVWTDGVSVLSTSSSYTTSNTGTYIVAATATCAVAASETVTVNNFTDNLQVSIVDSAAVCAKTSFILNAVATGGRPNYSYNWFLLPGTNSISNTNTVNSEAPEAQGVYSVSIMVTDSCGYFASDVQLITVLPPCDIVIPNIITPNGDGANDFFKISNIEYHTNTVFTVYDRWGKKVYENQNYRNEWGGDGLNDGTYYYILDVPDDKKYNGFITIFSGK